MIDQFPAEEFDDWAKYYDQSVSNTQDFPFTGYEMVLDKVIEIARPNRRTTVLDLGTGTGNLALRFDAQGCEVWGTDFSASMLEIAQVKLPQAHFFQADLRGAWPTQLNRRFDRIVSAYVFHHFPLDQKIQIINRLIFKHLEPNGKIILADITFANQAALQREKHATGDAWEDEYYWLADETIQALVGSGLDVEFHQVSSCGGVFEITGEPPTFP